MLKGDYDLIFMDQMQLVRAFNMTMREYTALIRKPFRRHIRTADRLEIRLRLIVRFLSTDSSPTVRHATQI